jgi:hypothetical protein
MRDLKSRDLLASLEARIAEFNAHEQHATVQARQADDRECGANIGTCAAGLCCSGAGCKLPLNHIHNLHSANPR